MGLVGVPKNPGAPIPPATTYTFKNTSAQTLRRAAHRWVEKRASGALASRPHSGPQFLP